VEKKMENKLIVVIGAYGSGKSEYSINLAKEFSLKGEKVTLVDLDVVNPYFRSRDVQEKFAQEGIEVIAPEGENKYADIPMLSPRVMGAVQNHESTVILDVGGDPAGCRVLVRYVSNIKIRGYEMRLVINTKRPFTSNEEEIHAILDMLESASKLKITELICNTNLMEFTDENIIREGLRIVNNVAKEKDLKFENYLVLYLSKPWEMPIMKGI
jgi:tRNA uridine 5-carbamoylmethylation protein Kti12